MQDGGPRGRDRTLLGVLQQNVADRRISRVGVAGHDALEVAEHAADGLGRAAGLQHVPGCIVGRQAPDPPLRATARLHEPPVGFIGADHIVAQDVRQQLEVAGFQQIGERLLLVPHRLRRNDEAFAGHLAALAIERQVIEPLVDLERDGEIQRVTSARDQSQRPRCCLDHGIAATTVFVPLVPDDDEAALLDRHLLGVLGQLAHLLERPLAHRTAPLAVRQAVVFLARRQLQLRGRSMPALGSVIARGGPPVRPTDTRPCR